MQIRPSSFSFTLLLGCLAAVPYSGIDINLPALAATGAALGARPSDVGLTMSVSMIGLALTPLIYGPLSDRLGRKPVILFGLVLFVIASLGCAVAQSLPALIIFRLAQAVGASSTTLTFAIIRDLFDETSARTRIANVVVAINVVTVIAPGAGAALLAIGNWRLIYATQAALGAILILAVLLGFAESAGVDSAGRFSPAAVIRDYLRVVTHPVSFVFILVGAAEGAAVFAYVTGAPLFFIGVVGLRPDQYGMIFSACSAAVMCGAFLDGRLARHGVAPGRTLTFALALLSVAACVALAMTLFRWAHPALVATLLLAVALSFGLSMPNIVNATMQPLPDIAGAVSAVAGSIQMTAGAIGSGLVAAFFDGRSTLSMTAVMAASSLAALTLYLLVGRSAHRSHPHLVFAESSEVAAFGSEHGAKRETIA